MRRVGERGGLLDQRAPGVIHQGGLAPGAGVAPYLLRLSVRVGIVARRAMLTFLCMIIPHRAAASGRADVISMEGSVSLFGTLIPAITGLGSGVAMPTAPGTDIAAMPKARWEAGAKVTGLTQGAGLERRIAHGDRWLDCNSARRCPGAG